MTSPPDPSSGPHLRTDVVSDLLEGLLPATEGRAAAAHLEQCPHCHAIKDALVRTHAVLGESGRSPSPIPSDVFARVEASLRTESQQRAETTGVASMSAARERRKAGWPTRVLAAAAALAVLGGGGALAAQLVSGQNDTSSQAGSEPEQPPAGGTDDQQGSAPEEDEDAAAPGDEPEAEPPALTAAEFDAAVRSHLQERGLRQPGSEEPSFGDDGPEATLDPATTACVSQLLTEQGAGRLLQADETTFDGRDAVLAITTSRESESVHGYAIGGCDTDQAEVLYDEVVQTE